MFSAFLGSLSVATFNENNCRDAQLTKAIKYNPYILPNSNGSVNEPLEFKFVA
jgi:hypothetical protein